MTAIDQSMQCVLAVLFLLMVLVVTAIFPAPLSAQTPRPPAPKLRCAGHEVVSDRPTRLGSPQGWPTRVRVQKGGRVAWSVAGDVETGPTVFSVECRDVTGDGVPELVVQTYTGGAHCCWTLYFLALEPDVHVLLLYEAGNAGGVEVVDLDQDGRLELVLGDDQFAYFDSLCYACSPAKMPLVACYRDGRFHDCTRTFPAVVRKDIARWTAELRGLVAQTPRDAAVAQSIRGAALGLYATHALISEDRQGWDAVRSIAPASATAWLSRHRGRVLQWAASRERRLAAR